ncbi:MAG: pantetheine-phosphate adenylyltransferase [Planctomycetota bacterium]|jgi:pantetheine-phosphate adenylyltransferase|nr:pantetheine-phosphate adenylyltransferase [Planctomycetota bacterium]
MNTAVFPGMFEPITYGHLDVIERGATLCDELIVAVGCNPAKTPVFTPAERVEMIRRQVRHLPKVRVAAFDGLTVDFVRQAGAKVILRGIRTYADFEYEFQLAIANRTIAGVETVFIMASAEKAFISSSLIREACAMGGRVEAFVPPEICQELYARLGNDRQTKTMGLRGDEPPRVGADKHPLRGEINE